MFVNLNFKNKKINFEKYIFFAYLFLIHTNIWATDLIVDIDQLITTASSNTDIFYQSNIINGAPVSYTFYDQNGAILQYSTGGSESGYINVNGFFENNSSFSTKVANLSASNTALTYNGSASPDVFSLSLTDSNGAISMITFGMNYDNSEGTWVTSLGEHRHYITQYEIENSIAFPAITLPTGVTISSQYFIDSQGAIFTDEGGNAITNISNLTLPSTIYSNNSGNITISTTSGYTSFHNTGSGSNIFNLVTVLSNGQMTVCNYHNLIMLDDTRTFQLTDFGAQDNNNFYSCNTPIQIKANAIINTNGQTLTLNSNIAASPYNPSAGISFIGGGNVEFYGTNTYTGYTLFDTATTLIGNIPLSSSSYPSINVPSGQSINQTGSLTGSGPFIKDGPGTLQLSNTQTGNNQNSWTGATVIRNGTLLLSQDGQVPNNTVTFDSTYSTDSIKYPTVQIGSSLNNSLVVNMTTNGTIDTNGFQAALDSTSNSLSNLTLTKIGQGTLIAGNSGLAGTLTVKGGTLSLKNDISSASLQGITFLGGTLSVSDPSVTLNIPIKFGN